MSRVVAVGRKGNPGRLGVGPGGRAGQLAGGGSWTWAGDLGAEPLEVRALLSGQTVSLIKDVNAVETDPENLTPAGSNLFYTVEDSTDTGVDLMVTNAGGTQVLLDTGSPEPRRARSYSSRRHGGREQHLLHRNPPRPSTQSISPPDENAAIDSALDQQRDRGGHRAGLHQLRVCDGRAISGVLGSTLVFNTDYVQGDGGITTTCGPISPDSTTPTVSRTEAV